jgi:transcriptional regulator with XRE-family HTH domain
MPFRFLLWVAFIGMTTSINSVFGGFFVDETHFLGHCL